MKISVIIPSVDAIRAKEAIRGVQLQEKIKADEIIVVGRNLAALVNIYHAGIKIIENDEWLNASSARNIGAQAAVGDILLFVDDDCVPEANWISANLEALRGEDVGVATGRMPGVSDRYFARCLDLSGFWFQQNNTKRYCETFYSATMGIKSDVFKELNGFDKSIDIAEDVDFAARLIKKGYKCVYSPDIIVYHNHKRDTFYRSISYLYNRGKEYVYSLKYDIPKINFIAKVRVIIIGAIDATVKSYRLNKGSHTRIFKYLPGIFLQQVAWCAGTNISYKKIKNPETLIFFLTSACNLSCKHCFYWKELNRGNDLSFEQIRKLSLALGKFNSLMISGGEPFLRKDIVEICRLFIQNSDIKALSIPTNATFPEIIKEKVEELLKEQNIDITIGLSLDGMGGYHDKLRCSPGAFGKAAQTYGHLAFLKKKYSRLKITVNPTITKHNTEEVLELANFVKQMMPEVDYFWPCIARGNPKCPDQVAPDSDTLRKLNIKINDIFYKGRVDILSQRKIWDTVFELRIRTLKKRRQLVPCQAGRVIGVVDADGRLRACELRQSVGNIKENNFMHIWNSQVACLMRKSIKDKECYCAHECFIYPSFIRAPLLTRIKFSVLAMLKWEKL